MAQADGFKPGDVVFHPKRPEWGEGVVKQATRLEHQGKVGQRVTVTFANRGRVTINTVVVPLVSKEAESSMSHNMQSSGGWLTQLEQNGKPNELYNLPESMTDPFLSHARRLEATLASYRFNDADPVKLLEWGAAQTGLNDPLTKYTRQELEQAFPRFARDRDQHLAQLVRTLKSKGETALLARALQTTHIPEARAALKKAMQR